MEDRSQRTEDGGQRTEDGGLLKSEDRGQGSAAMIAEGRTSQALPSSFQAFDRFFCICQVSAVCSFSET